MANSAIDISQKHSLSIRVWHWVTYLALTASLVTVLLGSTLFKTKSNIAMVQEQLQQRGATVTKDQARGVAHEYSDKIWDTHKIIGYIISFLLLSRIIIEIAQPREEKLRIRIKNALGFRSANQVEKMERQHYLLVKRGYLFFYTAILVMAITGLGLAFEDAPYLKDIQKPIKSVHSFVQYCIYAYILFHIVGVILAETGKYKGIVSRMINNGK
jgi:Ni/Fe-hydrogenase 1 B-type cytochrome subunit